MIKICKIHAEQQITDVLKTHNRLKTDDVYNLPLSLLVLV
jgi:hypothetical protein